MRIAVGAKTDIGLVRQGNEDAYLVQEPLFVVADGMGGQAAGDVASSTAVDVISERSKDDDLSDEDSLRAVVRAANATIWERAQADPSLRGMGTTLTLVRVADSEARLAHVGDSRAYLFRDGELSQLTEDHTLVGRMVREGRMTAEEAEHHPQRSIITRALGVDAEVDVDTLSLALAEGDRVLICSDGLTSMVAVDAIVDVLTTEADPQRAADRLVQLALDNGGQDNVTVIILDLDGNAPAAPAGGAAARSAAPSQAAPAPPPSSADDTVMGTVSPTPSPRGDDVITVGRRRRLAPRLIGFAVLLALLAGGGYFLVRALLDNSYYVGVEEDGTVALFRGIPEEIAGMSFREVEQTTKISLDDLPEFLQDDVAEGMKADSLADAEDTIANLEERARQLRDATRRNKQN